VVPYLFVEISKGRFLKNNAKPSCEFVSIILENKKFLLF